MSLLLVDGGMDANSYVTCPTHFCSVVGHQSNTRNLNTGYDMSKPMINFITMENECEALPGVAYPGVRDNCSTLNTKTRI